MMDLRRFSKILVFAFCSISIPYNNHNAEAAWHIETVDGPLGFIGLSLALDTSNHPHIAYSDLLIGTTLEYVYYDGTWNIIVVDSSFYYAPFFWPSLALDSYDITHIIYNYYDEWYLWYAYDLSPTGEVDYLAHDSFSSITTDSDGNPHISYVNDTFLKYAYRDGSWNDETVDSCFYHSQNSIALDSSENPHISYHDTSQALKYAYNDGAMWHNVIVDSSESSSSSIALDSNGDPCISYVTDGDVLKYAWCDMGCNTQENWSTVTVDSVDFDIIGRRTSLALDSNDKPHIGYCDNNSGSIKYAHYDTDWHIEIVDSDVIIILGETSLALDSNNKPHMSYGDDQYLKYAYPIPTLTEWGIIIFMTVIMGIGVMVLRKRRMA